MTLIRKICGKMFMRQTTKVYVMVRWQSTQSELKLSQFVPQCAEIDEAQLEGLQRLLRASSHLVVLTGAGVSTESGIPDYRSAGIGLYARTNRRPVQYQDFVRSASARQRYWARNFVGWPSFSAFRPNVTHQCLADWESRGKLDHLITQNVDDLHRRAGNKKCIELHGTSHRVVCLSCATKLPRSEFQQALSTANPEWNVDWLQEQLAPDGDVMLPDDLVTKFVVPPCTTCGGVLKPDLVFFGDNVATSLVNKIYELVDNCDTFLVLGSSLFVYSGYRFAVRAHQSGKRIAIVNIGPTRADNLAHVKWRSQDSEGRSRLRRTHLQFPLSAVHVDGSSHQSVIMLSSAAASLSLWIYDAL